MDFTEFEDSCADYLESRYSEWGYTFEAFGRTDSTVPDIFVKKEGKIVFSLEVKEPSAQCGQFVAFADERTRSFRYSEMNHPQEASRQSLAILEAMAKDFDRYKCPSAKELGLDKNLYYDRIIDYYSNYKQSKFVITRESVESGEFIIFPTSHLKDYFDVSACYRKKKSGSHNPKDKELELLSTFLTAGYSIQRDDKYTNVLMEGDWPECFVLGEEERFQFRAIKGKLYRVTVLGKTENPNVIFSIRLLSKQKPEDLFAFEKMLKTEDF